MYYEKELSDDMSICDCLDCRYRSTLHFYLKGSHLVIKTLTGRTIPIFSGKEDNIEIIKQKILDLEGIPINS